MTLDTEPMYCAEQINIPDNLGEILKAYAKEVIRQQPGNIYEFSARYFAQVLSRGRTARARRGVPPWPARCARARAATPPVRPLVRAPSAVASTAADARPCCCCVHRAAGPARGRLCRPGRRRDLA